MTNKTFYCIVSVGQMITWVIDKRLKKHILGNSLHQPKLQQHQIIFWITLIFIHKNIYYYYLLNKWINKLRLVLALIIMAICQITNTVNKTRSWVCSLRLGLLINHYFRKTSLLHHLILSRWLFKENVWNESYIFA